MEFERVIAFCKKQGYETAQFLNEWRGYQCYEPIYKKDDVSVVGVPLIILVKDDEIRMSTPDEAFEQLDESD